MKSLIVNFKNCYGIKKLEFQFDFSTNKVYSIYAPNGTMKTSFSKTFNDFSTDKQSFDNVFTDRKSERIIIDENKNIINTQSVFVIEPYNETFSSNRTSLLLVNPNIKKEYDTALANIEDAKEVIIKQLKQFSGLTGRNNTPENEINKIFSVKSLFELLENLPEYSSNISIDKLGLISYSNLFSDKTISFLSNKDVQNEIKEYIEKYEELTKSSPILSKKFNHAQAQTVHKELAASGFFEANHSVSLFNGTTRDEYISSKDLEEKILAEKRKIISDKELEKRFNNIDKKISNIELRAVRDYLYDNQEILLELADINKLQKNIFLAYFYRMKDQIDELQSNYAKNKNIIKNAIKKAKEEKTQWEEVVEIFKKRFSVPFEISIENQEDVILKNSAPNIKFTFIDGDKKQNIDSGKLLTILSQGEKRALYLMNILFEINARFTSKMETILIIDDIADSFDYKNKYAIVEYLREITEFEPFYTIFLTHNFDFYRTIASRLNLNRKARYCIYKNDEEIKLKEEQYQNNPFQFWKSHLNENKYLLASIPFIRNLAEYCNYTDEFEKLTATLHIKSNTDTILISDIQIVIKKILQNNKSISLPNGNTTYISLLQEEVSYILQENNEMLELESKIILSIAIRHLAERFMIKKINDSIFVSSIEHNQTIELFKKYTELYPNEKETIQILSEVNIMTPESIHLNSFMYEPILDMSPINLKDLYKRLKNIG